MAVVHRGQPVDGGLDLDRHAVVLVAAEPRVGLSREREDGVLHRAHIALGRGIEYVTDEEVALWITVGQQRVVCYGGLLAKRHFTHREAYNDTSHTPWTKRHFAHGVSTLHTQARIEKYLWFQGLGRITTLHTEGVRKHLEINGKIDLNRGVTPYLTHI